MEHALAIVGLVAAQDARVAPLVRFDPSCDVTRESCNDGSGGCARRRKHKAGANATVNRSPSRSRRPSVSVRVDGGRPERIGTT